MCQQKGHGRVSVIWVGYPLSQATWEPFENLSGEESSEYLVIFIHIIRHFVYIKIWLTFLLKDKEAMAMKEGKTTTTTSQVN